MVDSDVMLIQENRPFVFREYAAIISSGSLRLKQQTCGYSLH
jgi:hypothetical protein